MKRIKIGNVIMCEFIAEGVNNKHTLVNTISGDLLISEFPVQISTAFYLEIIPSETADIPIDLSIFLGRRRIAGAQAVMPFEKGKTGIIALPNALIKVDAPSEVKVTISAEGSPSKTIFRKRILHAQFDYTSSNA